MEKVKIPNLESLVSGFNENNYNRSPTPIEEPHEDSDSMDQITHHREQNAVNEGLSQKAGSMIKENQMWDLLLTYLEERREKPQSGQRAYNLDADIIETLSQCDFKVSITQVVNSILRIFLISHLPRLMQMRKIRPVSLFDKYEIKSQ